MDQRRIVLVAAVALTLLWSADGTVGLEVAPRCQGHQATIVAERYTVKGTPGDDVIVDFENAGLIEGRGGDDLICVSGGFKEVYGGTGDDRVEAAHEQDYIYGGAGEDSIATGGGNDLVTDTDSADDLLVAGAGVDLIRFSFPYGRLRPAVRVDLARHQSRGHGLDRLLGFEQVEGTARPDTILGDGADNLIDGIRGGDRIGGRGGDDTILGAGLLVTEAGPRDRYDGSDPSLRGGPGADRIYAGAGADRLAGGPGDDLLDGDGPDSKPGDGGDGGGGRDRCFDLEAARHCESERAG